jgi:hypothetical protein
MMTSQWEKGIEDWESRPRLDREIIDVPADMGETRQMEQDEFDREGGAMSPSVSMYFEEGVMTAIHTMGSLDLKVFYYQHRVTSWRHGV